MGNPSNVRGRIADSCEVDRQWLRPHRIGQSILHATTRLKIEIPACPYRDGMINRLDVQIADFEGVFFDEFTPRLDFVTHQNPKHLVSGSRVLHRDLQQRAVGRVQRCIT